MKNLIKLRTPLCLIVVIGAMALLANLTSAEEHHSKRGPTGPTHPTPTATPTSAAAKEKSTGPTKPTPPPHLTDLRAKIAQMKLKEGNNVIHTEAGVKIMAEVKGGKVIGYNATDGNGKALTTNHPSWQRDPHGVGCYRKFCVRIPFDGRQYCFYVPSDCP